MKACLFPATINQQQGKPRSSQVIKRCIMKLHPATKCRKEDWQISSMTHWRWINDHGFPKPVKINNRCYYTSDQLQNEVADWFMKKFAE